MPTVQPHSGNIMERGAVSTGKWFRVKQWKKNCRNETEAIRFFRTPGTSYHMIRRHIPHDVTVQRQVAFSVRYYFTATYDCHLHVTVKKFHVSQPRNTSPGLKSLKRICSAQWSAVKV